MIPKVVQKQGDRAELIRKKVYEEGKTPAELGVKADPPPGEAPPTEPDPAIPPEVEPGKETLLPAGDYKIKYEEAIHQVNVLKGKIDSEVPDLISINRMMAGQISTLQSTISELQAKISKPPEEPVVSKPDPEEAQNLKDYQDNYPEIHRGQVIVMKKWVKSDEFKGMISSIVDEIIHSTVEPRVASVEKDVKKTAEDSFTAKLDDLVKDENGVPCWREINDDKEFTESLKKKKYRGVSDFDLLRNALAKGDAVGVSEFFIEWQKLKKPTLQPKDKGDDDGKPIVEDDIAPSKPGSTQIVKKTSDGAYKLKTFTRSFVKQFHTDVAIGQKYKNKPKEREKIAAEIDEAMANGLIVNG